MLFGKEEKLEERERRDDGDNELANEKTGRSYRFEQLKHGKKKLNDD